jgi:hypothetical protein
MLAGVADAGESRPADLNAATISASINCKCEKESRFRLSECIAACVLLPCASSRSLLQLPAYGEPLRPPCGQVQASKPRLLLRPGIQVHDLPWTTISPTALSMGKHLPRRCQRDRAAWVPTSPSAAALPLEPWHIQVFGDLPANLRASKTTRSGTGFRRWQRPCVACARGSLVSSAVCSNWLTAPRRRGCGIKPISQTDETGTCSR